MAGKAKRGPGFLGEFLCPILRGVHFEDNDWMSNLDECIMSYKVCNVHAILHAAVLSYFMVFV